MPAVGDWAEIRRPRRAEGRPIPEIGVLGIWPNTVRAALAGDGPPEYRRALAGSVADAFVPRVREQLQGLPGDAVDGARGADRVAVFDPDAQWAGRRAAADVSRRW